METSLEISTFMHFENGLLQVIRDMDEKRYVSEKLFYTKDNSVFVRVEWDDEYFEGELCFGTSQDDEVIVFTDHNRRDMLFHKKTGQIIWRFPTTIIDGRLQLPTKTLAEGKHITLKRIPNPFEKKKL